MHLCFLIALSFLGHKVWLGNGINEIFNKFSPVKRQNIVQKQKEGNIPAASVADLWLYIANGVLHGTNYFACIATNTTHRLFYSLLKSFVTVVAINLFYILWCITPRFLQICEASIHGWKSSPERKTISLCKQKSYFIPNLLQKAKKLHLPNCRGFHNWDFNAKDFHFITQRFIESYQSSFRHAVIGFTPKCYMANQGAYIDDATFAFS